LIDWPAIEKLARARARKSSNATEAAQIEEAAPIYAAAMAKIVPALNAALDANLTDVAARARVVDRDTWVGANIATFRKLMGILEAGMPKRGHGLGEAVVTITGRAVITRELGYLLGFFGQRILGQYDIALLSAETENGQLLFVDENIRATAAKLDVPLDDFRTWIAIHETTHAFEFECHDWLRPYLAAKLEAQFAALAGGLNNKSKGLGGSFAAALRGSGAGGNLMEGLMSEDARRNLREINAVMSLLEGFGDYIMDEVGKDLVPNVALISERFHARRAKSRGLEAIIMRLSGMDAKLEQYKMGEIFVAAVAAAGPSYLKALWQGPESLPSPEEMESPALWVDRIRLAPEPQRSWWRRLFAGA